MVCFVRIVDVRCAMWMWCGGVVVWSVLLGTWWLVCFVLCTKY